MIHAVRIEGESSSTSLLDPSNVVVLYATNRTYFSLVQVQHVKARFVLRIGRSCESSRVIHHSTVRSLLVERDAPP